MRDALDRKSEECKRYDKKIDVDMKVLKSTAEGLKPKMKSLSVIFKRTSSKQKIMESIIKKIKQNVDSVTYEGHEGDTYLLTTLGNEIDTNKKEIKRLEKEIDADIKLIKHLDKKTSVDIKALEIFGNEVKTDIKVVYAVCAKEISDPKEQSKRNMWDPDNPIDRFDPNADVQITDSTHIADNIIITNEGTLSIIAGCTYEKFLCMLNAVHAWMRKHPQKASLFRTCEDTGEDTEWKVYSRHVLLLGLMTYNPNSEFNTLSVLCGSEPNRYISLAKNILDDILPTAGKLYQDIVDAKTVDDLMKVVKHSNGTAAATTQ